MRLTLMAVRTALVLLISGLSARAQGLPAPAVGAYRPGVPITLNDQVPRYTPVLQPMYDGGTMLPASPSRPWIISSRFLYARSNTPGLGYGYRTSPNGEYSRHAYYYTGTGPFAGLERPFVRYENDHWNNKPVPPWKENR